MSGARERLMDVTQFALVVTLTDRARERLSRRAQCDAVEAAFRQDHLRRVAALIAAGVDQEDARNELLARVEGERQR